MDPDIQRLARRLNAFYPWVISFEMGVGVMGLWLGAVCTAIVGFGMAFMLWMFRRTLRAVDKWPKG